MKRILLLTALLLLSVPSSAQNITVPQVRADHPRLFFNTQTWPQIQARAEGPARPYLDSLLRECDSFTDDPKCRNTGPMGKLGQFESFGTNVIYVTEFGVESAKCALAWRLTRDDKYLRKCKKLLFESVRGYTEATANHHPVSWTSTSRILALCAYDWIYEALTDDERRAFIVPMTEHVRLIQPAAGLEIQGQHASPPTDGGFYGVNSLLWYCGLAGVGDGYCDELAMEELTQGYALCLEMMKARNDRAGDDGSLISSALLYTLGDYPWAHFNFMHTLKSATGKDIASDYPALSLYPNWLWWMWIRDDSYPGYIRTAGQGDTFHGLNMRTYPYMYEHLTQYAYFYKESDPVSARLAITLREKSPNRQLGKTFPFYPFILDENPDITPFTAEEMEHSPLKARHFEKTGQILMRSAWTDDATYCTFTAGTDGMYNHKHMDENNFIIYKHDHLAIDSGCRAKQLDYNLRQYCAQSVAHNVVLINKPGEDLPEYWGPKYDGPEGKTNDGGMYPRRSATVLAFETNDDFTYVASDATECYGEKAGEAVRQFIHVQPDYFIVYDRVASEDKSYPKRWLLHTENEPSVKGRVTTADCGRGRIFCETLLPAKAKIRKVGGPGKEFWSNGRNWPLDTAYVARYDSLATHFGKGTYFGSWRIELTPRREAVSDRFLNVLTASDTSRETPVKAILVKDAERDGVTLEIDGRSMTFRFNRDGAVGGTVEIDGVERPLTTTVQPQSGINIGAETKADTAKEELAANSLNPLPLGAVKPEGWLKYELNAMTEGLVGRLYEESRYLAPDNAWLTGEGLGWEEAPYWLRSFVKLAVLTGNERCLEVSRDWVEKILATQDADGWYGPKYLKSSPVVSDKEIKGPGTVNDIWAHMVMNEALLSWYEYSGDERVLTLLKKFFSYCDSLEGDQFINSMLQIGLDKNDYIIGDGKLQHWHWHIQRDRCGDLFPVLFRLYEMTGDSMYLSLSDRVYGALYGSGMLFLSQHTVNFAQRVSYWTLYSRRSHNPADFANASYWYDLHMAEWGQMPRGMYAADENIRPGCTDPRYGCESCSWAELTRSFQLLSDVTGDTKWADRNEDIVYNHASAAYTADWKELHYITAANQVNCDALTDHNYCNAGPMVAYSSHIYRCCKHNAALTFPLFCENLVKTASDGALVFWMYAPNSGTTGDASWKLETSYPFRENASLDIELRSDRVLRFRVPGWATSFEVRCGDSTATAAPGKLAEMALPEGRHRISIEMGAECKFTFWPRNGGVSVDRGPLTYSLAIGEKYTVVPGVRKIGGSLTWVESESELGQKLGTLTEVTPTTPWNYGLDISYAPVFRELELRDGVFHSGNAACEITVRGRRIPEWILQDGQSAELQHYVAYTEEELEELRFVPLCCQRLRLSVLPQVTDDPKRGKVWTVPASSTLRSERPGRIEGL